MATAAPISISSISPWMGVANSLRPMIDTRDMATSASRRKPPPRAKPWVVRSSARLARPAPSAGADSKDRDSFMVDHRALVESVRAPSSSALPSSPFSVAAATQASATGAAAWRMAP
ncbi:hypothetical protein D3C85_1429480 [compost metagenome]